MNKRTKYPLIQKSWKVRLSRVAIASLSLILSMAVMERPANAQAAELAEPLLQHQREMLKMLKTQIAGISTTAVVTITNNTRYKLKMVDEYSDSGKVDRWDNATTIEPNKAGGFAASMKKTEIPLLGPMGFAGAVGTVVYNIEGTKSAILILYSVPYSQTGISKGTQNHFAVSTYTPFATNTNFAEVIFDQAYKTAHRAGVRTFRLKETRDVAQNDRWTADLARYGASQNFAEMNRTLAKIEALKHNKWLVDVNMTDSGNSVLNITISEI